MPTMRRAEDAVPRRRCACRRPSSSRTGSSSRLLRNAVEAAKGESGWARVGAVGQQIGNQASFDSRNYGYSTLTKLLKATDLFQLDKEGTSEVAVRDMRSARARRADGLTAPANGRTKKKRLRGAAFLFLQRAKGAARLTSSASRLLPASPAGWVLPALMSALVFALRSARVVSTRTSSALSSFSRARGLDARRPSAPRHGRPWSWPCARRGSCPTSSTAASIGPGFASGARRAGLGVGLDFGAGGRRSLREGALREHGHGSGDGAQNEIGLHRISPDY